MTDPRSRTAEAIALFRAIESAQPPAKRRFHDPYAASLVSGPFRVAARLITLPGAAKALERFFDRVIPGVRSSAVVRTQLIDEAVAEAIGRGCGQLVLLGAGFDSRPYRLDVLETIDAYEVDCEDIQRTKIERLRRSMGHVPARVRFVPIDFETDDLGTALRQAGLREEVPVVFVWEGVTYYLTDDAVDATLRILSNLSPPLSRLIFTYMDRGVVDGTASFDGDRKLLDAVRRVGERFTFGLKPPEVQAYLRGRGFDLVGDTTTREAACSPGRDEGSAWEHVAIAVRE